MNEHASKVLLRVLTKRLQAKAEADGCLGEDQFGFRKGRGTRDAIGALRMMAERSLESKQEVYICFVDYEKAFDRVDWKKLINILRWMGVDWRDRRSIRDGILPSQKKSILIPVLKGDSLDLANPMNYRSIANVSFKKIVAGQLIVHLKRNNLLPQCQSGFRKFHSTETLLLRLLFDIYGPIDRTELTLLACLMSAPRLIP